MFRILVRKKNCEKNYWIHLSILSKFCIERYLAKANHKERLQTFKSRCCHCLKWAYFESGSPNNDISKENGSGELKKHLGNTHQLGCNGQRASSVCGSLLPFSFKDPYFIGSSGSSSAMAVTVAAVIGLKIQLCTKYICIFGSFPYLTRQPLKIKKGRGIG